MNPFELDYHTDGSPHAPGPHEPLLRKLEARLPQAIPCPLPQDGVGMAASQLILLQAPRAGYGKSHLLSVLKERCSPQAQFLNLRLNYQSDGPPGWARLYGDLLEAFRETPLTESSEVTRLDQVARHFFAQLAITGCNAGLVRSNHDGPESDQEYLEQNYLHLFDPHTEPAECRVPWLQDNFHDLLKLLAFPLADRLGLEEERVKIWGEALFQYAFFPDAWDSQIQRLNQFSDRLICQLLREFALLAAPVSPIVFTLDHLDGFHERRDVGLRLAGFLDELGRHVPGSLTILALNQDLWDTLFAGVVPSMLEDRLTRLTYSLRGISADAARDILLARLLAHEHSALSSSDAEAFLDKLPLDPEETFTPRQALRMARNLWEDWEMEVPATTPSPSTEEVLEAVEAPEPTEDHDGTPTDFDKELESAPEEEAEPYVNGKTHELFGGLLPDPDATFPDLDELPASSPPPELTVFTPSDSAETSLAELYQDCRLQQLQHPDAKPDVRRLHHLISAAGYHFPLVQQKDLLLLPETAGTACIWEMPRREVFLAFLYQSNPAFWEDLARSFQDAPSRTPLPRKLMLISAQPDCPVPEGVTPVPATLDRLELRPELIASLHAADELLLRADDGSIPSAPQEVLGFLAGELDYFWNRLTRLPAAAS